MNNPLEIIEHNGLVPATRLTLSITRYCNLHCRHCWVESGPDPQKWYADTSALLKTLSRFGDAGLEQVCISGGEPLTHPDWRQILTHCAQLPSIARIRLQTNATLFTEEIVAFLAQPEFSGLQLQISLDGAKAATHDLVRGTGNHAKTLHGLHLIVQAGLGPRTTVSFTEMAHNFEEFPQLLRMMHEIGIGFLVCGTLINGGRATENDRITPPSPEQYQWLIRLFNSDEQFKSLYQQMGSISCLEWYAGRKQPAEYHCSYCYEAPYIDTTGTLYPCGLLSTSGYGIPDLWDRSLADIAEAVRAAWAGLRELSQSRPQRIPTCISCSGQAHCQSGCMGRLSHEAVDFMATEDRCQLRQTLYDLPD